MRQRPLTIVGVDHVGNHPVLCAFKFVGGHALLDDLRENGVDRSLRLAAGSSRASVMPRP